MYYIYAYTYAYMYVYAKFISLRLIILLTCNLTATSSLSPSYPTSTHFLIISPPYSTPPQVNSLPHNIPSPSQVTSSRYLHPIPDQLTPSQYHCIPSHPTPPHGQLTSSQYPNPTATHYLTISPPYPTVTPPPHNITAPYPTATHFLSISLHPLAYTNSRLHTPLPTHTPPTHFQLHRLWSTPHLACTHSSTPNATANTHNVFILFDFRVKFIYAFTFIVYPPDLPLRVYVLVAFRLTCLTCYVDV